MNYVCARSSVSSVINSLAAVSLEDFISPAVFYFRGVTLTDGARRLTAIVLGAIVQTSALLQACDRTAD